MDVKRRLGPDDMANFNPVSLGEVLSRVLKEIILK